MRAPPPAAPGWTVMTTIRPRARVLVVDDEEPLARLVAEYLTRAGFDVGLAPDGLTAVQLARATEPDVVVLDLGLPGLDGIEVCRQLRTFTDCYVIMLTARTDEVDKLIGLSVGADDYLTKPFSPRELVARVQVMLRRPRVPAPAGGAAGDLLRFGPLVLDVAGREVHLDGDPVDLTRRQLIDAVWGATWVGDEHLVDDQELRDEQPAGQAGGAPRSAQAPSPIRYPTPRTVRTNRASAASSPSLRRRWPMWTSTRCSSPTQVAPQTASMSWRRVNTTFGRLASVASRSNSVRVRSTGSPSRCTSRPATSRTSGPNRSRSPAAPSAGAGTRGRRSMTWTRATSSRGLNGLVR